MNDNINKYFYDVGYIITVFEGRVTPVLAGIFFNFSILPQIIATVRLVHQYICKLKVILRNRNHRILIYETYENMLLANKLLNRFVSYF